MNTTILLICIQLLILLNIDLPKKNEVEIKVDLKQQSERISPLIYGQFIEFLGRCIEGGIYEENSPLSNEQGFRTDVLEKVKALKTPLLRFPGGTVVKTYHWKDGIGPKKDRPKRRNLIWGGTIDNHFGTAEFVEYCRSIGAEPFLVINMSTDSPSDASDWVEYCNGTGDTYWANLRRAHGYDEPFNVRYWGIGNEEYAEPDAGIHQDVDRYIRDSWHILKLMKLQDPNIKITLVGNSEQTAWDKKVVSEMHEVCDYLAIHFYSMPADEKFTSLLDNVDHFNQKLDTMRTIIKSVPDTVTNFSQWYRFPPRPEPLKLAIDEWGIWDMQSGKGTGDYNMEYPYTWAHALAVGKFIHMFQRNADIIGLATWAQTVNVLAPITTTEKGSYKQTVYTPLQAYRTYNQQNDLPIEITLPESEHSTHLIDATASISDDHKEITLSILNLSETEDISTTLDISGMLKSAKIKLDSQISYTAPSLTATNTFGKEVVTEQITSFNKTSKGTFKLSLAPASINFIRLTVN